MPAIETRELSKDYYIGFWRPRPYRALDRVSFSVEPGEVFGFLGPNGAGKTTTLKLLMQLVFPSGGSATILGKPVGALDVKRRIGYLPENPYFYDNLTAEELLHYFAGLFGYRGAARRDRVSRLLDEVGLGAERRMHLRKFSKGMIQRVGLAQALVNDPEVIFLDEPMSGLDPLGRRDVRQMILRLRDEGRTVFFSSHILSDAEALCSRIAILAGGRLMAAGSLSEMLALQTHGWEIVIEGVKAAPDPRLLGATVRRITRIKDGSYSLELAPEGDPVQLVPKLLQHGGTLVSVTRLHETLEDVFVRKIDQAAALPAPGRRGTRPRSGDGSGDVSVPEPGDEADVAAGGRGRQ
jgi:ABC-2 type transport system ATP-binding protein